MPTREELEQELVGLRRRHAELELLYETIRDLGGTLAVSEVLDRLLARVLQHLDAELGSILLLDPSGTLRIAVARGLPVPVVEHTRLEPGQGISGTVVESGRPLLVHDIERDPRFHRRNHERYYTRSLLCAPLLQRGAVRGAINVNNKRSRDPFDERDLQLLEAIAGHASAALANADDYQRVLERAQRDSLTGLANHGHFWATLEVELQRSARHGRSLGLVMLDVDHFKRFNDRLGHPAGDAALRHVAAILCRNTRAHDLVARYGGEEFAVLLPETDLTGTRAFAEKIREHVEAFEFDAESGEPLTVSAGAAVWADGVSTARQLVERADRRLYDAKAAGRNRVVTTDAS